MSTGSAWNPKLHWKNSLAWGLTIINGSRASFPLEVRNVLAGQISQKSLLQLQSQDPWFKRDKHLCSLKTSLPGLVRWKHYQFQSYICLGSWEPDCWFCAIQERTFRFWVTFSLWGVPLRYKELHQWFIRLVGSITFVACLGDPLLQCSLYEQLILDNAVTGGWELCVGMCANIIVLQVAKPAVLYRA